MSWLMYKLLGDAPPLPSAQEARAEVRATEPARLERAQRELRKGWDGALKSGETQFQIPANNDTKLLVEPMRALGWEVDYHYFGGVHPPQYYYALPPDKT